MPLRTAFLAAALASLAAAAPALAYDPALAGAPQAESGPDRGWTDYAPHPMRSAETWRDHAQREGGECWAQVKYPAQFAPPASGPEYVWTRQPGPPGAPGPIWCLTVQPLSSGPVMVSPERLGWIRVLCSDEATPRRIADVQRQLSAQGLYQGRIDGRYDEQTTYAVRRFQTERHIEHRGYLSYETLAALQAPAPAPVYYRTYAQPRYTTFDTGYVTWPGKLRY